MYTFLLLRKFLGNDVTSMISDYLVLPNSEIRKQKSLVFESPNSEIRKQKSLVFEELTSFNVPVFELIINRFEYVQGISGVCE
jgi:hypothetical protein